MKTNKEVAIRSIIAGIIYAVLGLGFDYLRYHTLKVGSIISNVIEAIIFAVFMFVLMVNYYKRKATNKK